MNTLTPELKRAVDDLCGAPLRLKDPETQKTYVVLSAEVFDRLMSDLDEHREESRFLNLAMKNAKARLRDDE